MRTTALRQRLSPRIADAGRWQYWAFYNLNHEAHEGHEEWNLTPYQIA